MPQPNYHDGGWKSKSRFVWEPPTRLELKKPLKQADLTPDATLTSEREDVSTEGVGGKRTLEDVSFLDDDEKEWYEFESWRRMMESNRPVLGVSVTNRDWLGVDSDGQTYPIGSR